MPKGQEQRDHAKRQRKDHELRAPTDTPGKEREEH